MGVGILLAGYHLIGADPFKIGDAWPADHDFLISLLSLALGLAVVLNETANFAATRWVSRALLVVVLVSSVFYAVTESLPGALAWPFVVFSVASALAVIASLGLAVPNVFVFGLSAVAATFLATDTVALGWTPNNDSQWPGFLINVIGLVAMAAPIRWGALSVSSQLRLIAAVPLVFTVFAFVTAMLNTIPPVLSSSAIAASGMFVSILVMLWIANRTMSRSVRQERRRTEDVQRALAQTQGTLDALGAASWRHPDGECGIALSVEASALLGRPRIPLTGELDKALKLTRETGESFRQVIQVDARHFELRGRLSCDRDSHEVVGMLRDVTEEQKILELAHLESVRMTQAATAVIDIVFLYDIRQRAYTYVNTPQGGVLKEMATNPSGAILTACVHLDDKAALMQFLGSVESSRSSDVHTMECRFVDSSNSISWLRVRCRVIEWDEDGRAAVVRGTVEDVTSKQVQLQASRDNEARLRAIMASTPGIVFRKHVSPIGIVTFPFLSEACEDIIGIPADAAMKDSDQAVARIHPDDRDRYAQSLADSVRSLVPMSWIGRVLGPGNQTKWIHIRSTPTRLSDGSTIFDGIALDVTDTQNALAAVQQANQRLDFLLEESPTIVYSASGIAPYHVDYVGNNMRNLFGHTPAEFINRPLFKLPWLDTEDAEGFLEHQRLFIDHGHSSFEYRVKGASGATYWVRDEIHLVSISDNEYEVIGSWTDITPLKKAIGSIHSLNKFEEQKIIHAPTAQESPTAPETVPLQEVPVLEQSDVSEHNGSVSLVVVSQDATIHRQIVQASWSEKKVKVRFAATVGIGLEMCLREAPHALVVLEAMDQQSLFGVNRALRAEPSLRKTMMAVAESAETGLIFDEEHSIIMIDSNSPILESIEEIVAQVK